MIRRLLSTAAALVVMAPVLAGSAAGQGAFCSSSGHDHCNPRSHEFERGLRKIRQLRVSDGGGLGRIELHGKVGAVLEKDEGSVAILDVSRPTRPTLLGRYDDDARQSLDGDLAFSKDGKWVFYARQTVQFSRDGVHVLDISEPENPRLAFYQPLGGASRVLYYEDAGQEWVVVLDAISGLVVNRFDPLTGVLVPEYVSAAPVAKVGGPASAGLALERSKDGVFLYVTTGRTGLEVFDFRDPAMPRLIGSWTEQRGLAEVEVASSGGRRHVYVASEYWFAKTLEPNVIVLDATDFADIKEVSRWNAGFETGDLWRLQGMAVMRNLLLVAHSHAGVIAFDGKGKTILRSDAFGAERAEGSGAPAAPYAFDIETRGSFLYVTDAASGTLTVLKRG